MRAGNSNRSRHFNTWLAKVYSRNVFLLALDRLHHCGQLTQALVDGLHTPGVTGGYFSRKMANDFRFDSEAV